MKMPRSILLRRDRFRNDSKLKFLKIDFSNLQKFEHRGNNFQNQKYMMLL